MTDKPRMPRGQKFPHFGKPYVQWLIRLLKNPQFQERLATFRKKWGIQAGGDPIEAWHLLVEKGNLGDDEYADKWDHLNEDLADLASNGGFGPDNWSVPFYLSLYPSPEALTANLERIRVPRDMGRIDIVERQRHLYLDVTWATKEDVDQHWSAVLQWQETTGRDYVKKGLLPDLLRDIKPGRPVRDDDIAIQCARWKGAGKTFKQIRELVKQEYGLEWALTESSLNRSGAVCYTCPTAKNYVKRGRQLLEQMDK